jgi:hypothetical protein
VTAGGPLDRLFERLVGAENEPVIVCADEAALWPEGTLTALVRCGLLARVEPAQAVECDGCEQHCVMPVYVLPAVGPRTARAFISCDKRDDVGRVPVEFRRLEQWHCTGDSLAAMVARLLGFTKMPGVDASGKRWLLGLLAGSERHGEVGFSLEGGARLFLAGHSIPLIHVLMLTQSGLTADVNALIRVVEGAAQTPAAGVGSAEWRTQKARKAANAKHDKPDGAHQKWQRMREIWAQGHYDSRDRCAEEECGALDMSFSAARKALRNTPNPQPPSRC